MLVAVRGRHVGVSGRSCEHVCECLESAFGKYFTSAVAAHLVFLGSQLASMAQFLNRTEPEDVDEEECGEVLRIKMVELSARMFLNLSHDDKNVLFQRADRKISFFDPQIKTAE